MEAKDLRNVAIVLALATAVWALPGGGTAADVFGAALFTVLTVGIGLLGARLYQERRGWLETLGEQHRGMLYGAFGLLLLTLASGDRLFASGPGTLAWIAGLALAGYLMYRVWRHARAY